MCLTNIAASVKICVMKIWAKTVSGDKILREIIYENPLPTKYDNYRLWIAEICRTLDLSTPVILPAHYKNFVLFHNTRFRQDDFVDDLGADMLVVEDCRE